MNSESGGSAGGSVPALDEGLRAAIEANLLRVLTSLAGAARRAGRRPEDVSLLPITKYVGVAEVRALYSLGLRDFGESTVQGLSAKANALADLAEARWHLVGHLQRNKVPRALLVARSVHSIDSERLLREIFVQATRRQLRVPPLYVEVNVAQEPRKTGLDPTELGPLLRVARGLYRHPAAGPPPAEDGGRGAPCDPAPIAGLMCMAPLLDSAESARPHFRRLRELRDGCVREGLLPDGAGLSMGMSGDFVVAVEEGATVVRVGSTLFEGIGEAPPT